MVNRNIQCISFMLDIVMFLFNTKKNHNTRYELKKSDTYTIIRILLITVYAIYIQTSSIPRIWLGPPNECGSY